MENKTSKCCTCGYQWQTGTHGGHNCSEHLLKKIEKLSTALKPFSMAFEPRAEYYYHVPEDFNKERRLWLEDNNVITPQMTMGDSRRAYEALKETESN